MILIAKKYWDRIALMESCLMEMLFDYSKSIHDKAKIELPPDSYEQANSIIRTTGLNLFAKIGGWRKRSNKEIEQNSIAMAKGEKFGNLSLDSDILFQSKLLPFIREKIEDRNSKLEQIQKGITTTNEDHPLIKFLENLEQNPFTISDLDDKRFERFLPKSKITQIKRRDLNRPLFPDLN